MGKDLSIIIQGPSDNIEELKKKWVGYNLIWSTWKGNEEKYNDNDIVIFDDGEDRILTLGENKVELEENGWVKKNEIKRK